MASITCNELTVEVNCVSNQAEITFDNGNETAEEAWIVIPPGGIIKDPTGSTIYENSGSGPKKCNVRIP